MGSEYIKELDKAMDDDWDDQEDFMEENDEIRRTGALVVYSAVVSLVLFVIGIVWLCKRNND